MGSRAKVSADGNWNKHMRSMILQQSLSFNIHRALTSIIQQNGTEIFGWPGARRKLPAKGSQPCLCGQSVFCWSVSGMLLNEIPGVDPVSFIGLCEANCVAGHASDGQYTIYSMSSTSDTAKRLSKHLKRFEYSRSHCYCRDRWRVRAVESRHNSNMTVALPVM